MGWMRTLLLGDIGNRLDITDTEVEIDRVKQQNRNTVNRLRNKEEKIDQLTSELAQQRLATQALTRFLIAKNLVSEQELNEFIQEVDAEDGVVDGKLNASFTYKRPSKESGGFGKIEWT